jgi:two-component system chemotaxis response regulator CheY
MVSLLLVDDELSILELYKMLFTSVGFKIEGMAKNGKEAVDMYKSSQNKPDVIIMDHRMPIMNGIEASKEILEYDKNAKIIFASADSTVQYQAISLGVISFEGKPFNIESLLNNVKKATERAVNSIH